MKSLGYEQITDLDPAVGLTIPDGTSFAVIQCEGAGVRWRDDGTSPTAAVGMILNVGEELIYDVGQGLDRLEFFELSTASILNVSYYGG